MHTIDPICRAETYLKGADLLDSPGGVLYSSTETLKPGPVYLLGLNPGGSEQSTLRDSISASRRGHNAFLDECFAPGGYSQPKGEATLQRRVQHLCKLIGRNIRCVPASNLVFTRSTRMGVHLNFDDALELCFPVHKIFLEVIKPKFLMTFGAITNFRKCFRLEEIESRSAQHGSWQAHRGRVQVNGSHIRFGNIPHMSVWASDQREEVVRWVIEGAV